MIKKLILSTVVIVMALINQSDVLGKAIYVDSLTVSNEDMAEATASRMARELSLDQQQKEKVYKLLMQRAEEMEMEYEKKGSIEQNKLTTINERNTLSLSTILTEEQQRLYNKLKEELKAQKKVKGEKGKETYQDLYFDF